MLCEIMPRRRSPSPRQIKGWRTMPRKSLPVFALKAPKSGSLPTQMATDVLISPGLNKSPRHEALV
jgi:hypothetical protein